MIKEGIKIVRFWLLIYAVMTFGCAFDLAHVKYQSAKIDAAGADGVAFTLTEDTPIHGAPCGYSRTLRKDTRWDAVGKILEGVVYRSRDQTLTIECSNVFEVYLVVSGQRLVGFYLPVEKGFSPIDEPIQLPISGEG